MTESKGEGTAKEVLAWWRAVVHASTEKGKGDAVIDKALRVLAACEEWAGQIALPAERIAAEIEQSPLHHGHTANLLRTLATLMQEGREK